MKKKSNSNLLLFSILCNFYSFHKDFFFSPDLLRYLMRWTLFFSAKGVACTSAVLLSKHSKPVFTVLPWFFSLWGEHSFERKYLSWEQTLPYHSSCHVLIEMAFFHRRQKPINTDPSVCIISVWTYQQSCTRVSHVLLLEQVNSIWVDSIVYPVELVPLKMRLHLIPKNSVLTCHLFQFHDK